MAYITKRGNSYSVRYTYQDEHGKSCDKWESFPTKEEATNRKKQIEHELATGTFLIPSTVTVAEFLMDWLPKQCSKHKWAPKTYESNLSTIQNLIIPCIGSMEMQKLKPYHMENLYTALSKTPCGSYIEGKKQELTEKQKQRFLSGTTIHEVHRLLGTAFQYAVEWGILVKSPVPVDSPKKSTQERTIWTVEEMRAALDSMEDPILHLAVHLTLVGALREGEIVGLTPEDIDFDAADGIGTLKCRLLFDNYNMNLVTRGKRIIPLNDSLVLVSAMQGTLLVNIRELIGNSLGSTPLKVSGLEYVDASGIHHLPINTQRISLPHNFQEFNVWAGTTIFTSNHQISYKIEGVSSDWSAWQHDGKITFLQLPEGRYELKVRKYVIKGPYPELTLPIEVRPPWYNTVWAWLVYITLVWFLVQAVLRYNLKNLHKEEQEKAEAERQAEQQQMQVIKNRMLEAELQNKNNELTLQTTALVKRNQAVQSLLEELEKQKETLGERYPNKLYIRMKTLMEETLNNQADWVLFESYFNSTHQNFTDRLRQRYSDLTTGDLRICCLLRMNLSTKEIASLMNVSVRAIELRRYRLRKRLELEGDTNLVDFLMNF